MSLLRRTAAPRHRYRRSFTVRRAGIAALAAIVILIAGAISVFRFAELDAAGLATVVAAFWGLGLVALLLLARGGRSR